VEAKKHIERLIDLTRPNAKFIAVSHSNEFTEPLPELGDGYYYVSLYDEKIDSLLNKTNDGKLYLIHNTYLSSFAYNLYLCLFYSQQNEEEVIIKNNPLLTHNFKKFFAEQLYAFNNNIFSRAILLETLLYEQQMMVPVFEQKSTDKVLNKKASFASSIMSSLISFHELGHYFLEIDNTTWNTLLRDNKNTLGVLYEKIKLDSSQALLDEFKCDAIAVLSCINQYSKDYGIEAVLKSALFGFAAYAVLSSLVKSAEATSIDHKKIVENVDFLSIEKQHRDYDYKIGIDNDFVLRTKIISALCMHIAHNENIDLFGKQEGIYLPESLLNDMLNIINIVMDSNDSNARKMSMLVAEALHNHPEGMEYLYLRSKVFESVRDLKL